MEGGRRHGRSEERERELSRVQAGWMSRRMKRTGCLRHREELQLIGNGRLCGGGGVEGSQAQSACPGKNNVHGWNCLTLEASLSWNLI
jgi:hypothetical protein